MTPTDRRWSDADRELVARAMFEEAHEGDHDAFRWEDLKPHYEEQAEAALDALAADGRLADPQELERLREERSTGIQSAMDAISRSIDSNPGMTPESRRGMENAWYAVRSLLGMAVIELDYAGPAATAPETAGGEQDG